MMIAYTPMLAHDPEMIMGLFVGALLLVALLHALWYWFVSQVGFMLASIGTRVERMSKILLPLVLVPVSGMCTLGVFVFALLAGSGEERTMWSVLAGLLLLLFLPGVPYVIGRCMLRFSRKRSMIAALCQAAVYGVIPFGLGLAVPDEKVVEEEMTIPAPIITSGEANDATPADAP